MVLGGWVPPPINLDGLKEGITSTIKSFLMVTISNFKAATNAEGDEFMMLELMGGVESVQSKETGKFYLTARKTYVSSTFDKAMCQSLIGTKMPGSIKRVDVDPYPYIIKETGEEITLSHQYEYDPKPSMEETVLERTNELVLR